MTYQMLDTVEVRDVKESLAVKDIDTQTRELPFD